MLGAVSSAAPASRYPRVALPAGGAGVYGYASGTSFATPEVAGAAALVWAANPKLTARQVAAILERTATGRSARKDELGYGVIDAGAAVTAAR